MLLNILFFLANNLKAKKAKDPKTFGFKGCEIVKNTIPREGKQLLKSCVKACYCKWSIVVLQRCHSLQILIYKWKGTAKIISFPVELNKKWSMPKYFKIIFTCLALQALYFLVEQIYVYKFYYTHITVCNWGLMSTWWLYVNGMVMVVFGAFKCGNGSTKYDCRAVKGFTEVGGILLPCTFYRWFIMERKEDDERAGHSRRCLL